MDYAMWWVVAVILPAVVLGIVTLSCTGFSGR